MQATLVKIKSEALFNKTIGLRENDVFMVILERAK